MLAATTLRAGRTVYVFSIRSVRGLSGAGGRRSADAVLARVFVAPTTGRVVSVVQRQVAGSRSGSVGRATSGRAALLPLAGVRAQAVAAVGGGQVLDVTRTEPNDRGVWAYRVRVLLPTSAAVDVTVAEHGGVLAVAGASDG